MIWEHVEFSLGARARGFHLVTEEVVSSIPILSKVEVGLCHLLLLHTSASLTLNENADPTVRQDFESFFNRSVPEDEPYFIHTYEGSDDMPAHLKSSILGTSLSIPIYQGRFRLGTWQGIYLGEHRDSGGSRRLVATVQGR